MNSLKKYSLVIAFSLCFQWLWGQQLTQYTNFIFNYQLVNPAATGYTTCTEIKSNYRQQWSGIDGAPKTTNVFIHGRLRAMRNAFQGLGANIESDAYGAFGATSLMVNYAYHTRVSKGYNLAGGIALGLTQIRIDYSKINFADPYNETVINGVVSDYIFPNINAGVWLYRGDRFYGLSIKSLTNSPIDGLQTGRYNRHYSIVYGKYIKISKELAFKPSFMFRWVKGTRPAIDAQALLTYRKRYSLGFAARNGHGVSGIVKFDLYRQLSVSYAYDLTLNRLKYGSYHTHEISLALKTCAILGKEKELCAAYE
jgi:type IX secretion system PorP/SprF family membrane protein